MRSHVRCRVYFFDDDDDPSLSSSSYDEYGADSQRAPRVQCIRRRCHDHQAQRQPCLANRGCHEWANLCEEPYIAEIERGVAMLLSVHWQSGHQLSRDRALHTALVDAVQPPVPVHVTRDHVPEPHPAIGSALQRGFTGTHSIHLCSITSFSSSSFKYSQLHPELSVAAGFTQTVNSMY